MIFCLAQIWETMFFSIMNITLLSDRTMGMRDIAKILILLLTNKHTYQIAKVAIFLVDLGKWWIGK